MSCESFCESLSCVLSKLVGHLMGFRGLLGCLPKMLHDIAPLVRAEASGVFSVKEDAPLNPSRATMS